MPARKIPKSFRNVTGRVSFGGTSIPFESPLEADFYRLLRFDQDVESITAQPVKVPYVRADGSSGFCYPDALVTYRGAVMRRPMLCEVKLRSDLIKDWKDLKPKLKAARRYAAANRWTFKIVTEVEIRTPYLKNVDFLQEFREREVDQLRCQRILRAFRGADDWTIEKLVNEMAIEFKAQRVEILPLVWHLVATYQLPVNLELPLDPRKPILVARPK